MEPLHHPQAYNFNSAVIGSVDPRTGLYSANIPIFHAIGNYHNGPDFSFILRYDILNTINSIYGRGISDNLTRYNGNTKMLTLSSGQSFHVKDDKSQFELTHADPDNVKIQRIDNDIWIGYKNGLIEKLSSIATNDISKFVSEIYTPSGRKLSLNWEGYGNSYRLIKIQDEKSTLLIVEYSATGGGIKFSLWPDSTEGYTIKTSLKGRFLHKVIIDTAKEKQTWLLNYTRRGNKARNILLTEIKSPMGRSEIIEYNLRGHRVPEYGANANSKKARAYIPYVKSCSIEINKDTYYKTSYSYSDKNYLGYGGKSQKVTAHGEDYLYNVDGEYQYFSEETVRDRKNKKNYKIKRIYNCFHLMVSEQKITSDDKEIICQKTNDITYYADITKSFENQLSQFQMPKEKTIIWTKGSDTRKIITKLEYDEHCNLLSQEYPDGIKHVMVYYPKDGEGELCPADPLGFQRSLKSITVHPAPNSGFTAQVKKEQYQYISVNLGERKTGLTNNLLLQSQKETYSDDILIQKIEMEYNKDAESDNFCHLKNKTLSTALEGTLTKRNEESYEWSITDNGEIQCKTTLKSIKDDISITDEKRWTKDAYRLVYDKSYNGNIKTYQYDKLGRLLQSTQNPETIYENTVFHTYSYDENSNLTMITHSDYQKNGEAILVDALGRMVAKHYFTKEVPNGFQVQSYQYNKLGQLEYVTDFDLFNPQAPIPEQKTGHIVKKYLYDDWQENCGVIVNDSVHIKDVYDPIENSNIHQMISVSDNTIKTGSIKQEYNAGGNLIKTIRTCSNTEYGVWEYQRDGLGRLRVMVDELGNKEQYDYNQNDLIINKKLSDNTEIDYQYDFINCIEISVTVDKNVVIGTRVYDGFGRVTEESYNEKKWKYEYLPSSSVPKLVTDPAGNNIDFEYVPELDFMTSKVSNGENEKIYDYDSKSGKLIKSSENGIVKNYSYNNSGKLISEKTESADFGNKNIYYNYTLAGKLISETSAGMETKYYTYNETCQLTNITSADISIDFKYDRLNRIEQQELFYSVNNTTMVWNFEFDELNREIRRSATRNAVTTIKIEQDYNLSDKIIERRIFSNDVLNNKESFNYDNRGRLSTYQASGSERAKSPAGNLINSVSYDWDPLNNILKREITYDDSQDIWQYLYENTNDPFQLTSVDINGQVSDAIEYDAYGRIITDHNGTSYSYDIFGRLTNNTHSDNKITSLKYDANNWLFNINDDGKNTQLYYQSTEIVNEFLTDGYIWYQRNNNECQGYLYSPTNTITDNKEFQYVETIANDMGSTIGYFNNSNEPNFISYTPEGYPSESIAASGLNGQRWFSPLNGYLLGNGYRLYHTDLCRFTAFDHLGVFDGGDLNPYSYCAGDPINLNDPTGHITGWGWASIVLGGVGLLLAPLTFGASLELGVGAALTLTALEASSGATAIASGALSEKDPKTSEKLGWISMGLGAPSAIMGMASLGKMAFRGARALAGKSPQIEHGFALGINQRKFQFTDPDINAGMLLFEDTYHGTTRLNVIAHGTINSSNTTGLAIRGEFVSAQSFVNSTLLTYDLNKYTYIRTLVCHSGEDGTTSFAQQLAQLTGKSVKGFNGKVVVDHNPEEILKGMWTHYAGVNNSMPLEPILLSLERNPIKQIKNGQQSRTFNYPMAHRLKRIAQLKR